MRVAWHPDGTRLLTVHRGAVRTHAGDAIVTVAERDRLDARWRDDGTIAAVDLDGELVVDGIPVGPARARVRGPAIVELRDTLWIDPDLDDIVALAFDPASRRIACLGAGGSVEIVPVP